MRPVCERTNVTRTHKGNAQTAFVLFCLLCAEVIPSRPDTRPPSPSPAAAAAAAASQNDGIADEDGDEPIDFTQVSMDSEKEGEGGKEGEREIGGSGASHMDLQDSPPPGYSAPTGVAHPAG